MLHVKKSVHITFTATLCLLKFENAAVESYEKYFIAFNLTTLVYLEPFTCKIPI